MHRRAFASASFVVTAALGAASCADPECGDAPHARVTAHMLAFPSNAAVSNAQLRVDICPELTFTTDWFGGTALRLQTDVPYVASIVADGFIPMNTGEQIVVGDFDGGAPMFPRDLADRFPQLQDDAPAILAITNVDADRAEGACASPDGIVFSVVDHPEAIVTYFGETPEGGVASLDESLTSTSTTGAAEIGGLAATDAESADDRVTLRAEKTGCDVAFASYPHTGRYALANGVLTGAAAFMPPIDAP